MAVHGAIRRHAKPGAARRGRTARDLLDGARRDDVAPVEDKHLRADLLDLGEQVRAEEHRRAAFSRDPANEHEHLSLSGRVEPESRLVEKHDLRLVDERPRKPSRCRMPRL